MNVEHLSFRQIISLLPKQQLMLDFQNNKQSKEQSKEQSKKQSKVQSQTKNSMFKMHKQIKDIKDKGIQNKNRTYSWKAKTATHTPLLSTRTSTPKHSRYGSTLIPNDNKFKKSSSSLQSSRSRISTNVFSISGQYHSRMPQKLDIFTLLQQQTSIFFTSITQEEKHCILSQLKIILQKISSNSQKISNNNEYECIANKLEQMQTNLSKYLKHRISHLYFYVILFKFLQKHVSNSKQTLHKYIKILILIEYHSRAFTLRHISLFICIELQQKYVKTNDFQKSREYAIKSLKLSVLLNDRYNEMKILEYLQLNNYYHGVMNVKPKYALTNEERYFIVKNYNEEDEVPKIFQFMQNQSNDPRNYSQNNSLVNSPRNYANKNKQNFNSMNLSSKRINNNNSQPNFQYNQELFAIHKKQTNFIVNGVPKTNIKKFNKNFHGILKYFKKGMNVQKIKQNIKKISTIGEVKKFIDKDVYITLRPQLNNFTTNNQSQIMVTHKKQLETNHILPYIPKQFSILLIRLNSFIRQQTEKLQPFSNLNVNDNDNDNVNNNDNVQFEKR